MEQYRKKASGFTLVELIVSVAITAIIMVGLSVFFSSSLRNMFEAREKTSQVQSQFLGNSVFQEKLSRASAVSTKGSDWAVLKNDLRDESYPFTYMGLEGEQLVFKDFFPFDGREGDLVASEAVLNLQNPAGLTKMGDTYYVAAPFENAIYQCGALPGNCDTKLAISGLKHPIDLTNDGTDLFVTDAGNNRVLQITNVGVSNDVFVLAEDLSFPTGLEYYAPDDGYLFVADTYAHQVKRINLADDSVLVVAGGGSSTDCHGTAQLCQLSYPTGLLIHNDGQEDALYIAEMGSGRVVKVTDPQPNLASYDLGFEVENNTKIKRLEFTFPQDTSLDTLALTDPNTLHKGKFSTLDNVATFDLTGTLQSNTHIKKCDNEDPPNCVDYFHGFIVSEEDNIFDPGDLIQLAGQNFSVAYVNPAPGGYLVGVNPSDTTISPPINIPVEIRNPFSGEYHFYFDFSQLGLPAGFNLVEIMPYDLQGSPTKKTSEKQILRIGDGLLGGSEDLISEEVKGFEYLTDLGWKDGQLTASGLPVYVPNFSSFDYRSKFKVKDVQFNSKNNGKLLELLFDAYLFQDAQGVDQYETYRLNAALDS